VIEEWFLLPRNDANSKLRLLLFPHAGGGAAVWRGWPELLPAQVSACPVLLPGREYRISEPPLTSMADLVEALLPATRALQDKPVAFYGHSLGALVAFELARHLRRQGLRGPVHLFVSGRRAPQTSPNRPSIYQLPDPEFQQALSRHYEGGIPAAILEEPDMLAVVLKILRGDFSILDTYRYAAEPPLDCPISVATGDQDTSVSADEAQDWAQQTIAGFRLRTFSGGHFFINTMRPRVSEALAEDLRSCLQPL
jgi:medium-chain acyl-[acyl-carrier-protein] hydrolase